MRKGRRPEGTAAFECATTRVALGHQHSYRTPSSAGGLVYSTDNGTMCPACRRPVADCVCIQKEALPAGDGNVRVSRETKGRARKGVTLVKGLALDSAGLCQLAKELKAACGSGGTVKDGVIEVQGDHRDRVIEHLKANGWSVKRAGG